MNFVSDAHLAHRSFRFLDSDGPTVYSYLDSPYDLTQEIPAMVQQETLHSAVAVEVAQEVATIYDPAEQLRAIRDIRVHLDNLEAEAVRDLRLDGASWQDIAEILRVTRSAAWQRFHDPAVENAADR
jgi:DNA-directed RNA polymerase specialized sigma24 family protein